MRCAGDGTRFCCDAGSRARGSEAKIGIIDRTPLGEHPVLLCHLVGECPRGGERCLLVWVLNRWFWLTRLQQQTKNKI